MNVNLLEIDELQLYFGDDYIVNDYISIHQPTVGEIVEFGEKSYYSMVQTITAIPSEMKSQLWDMGIDWTQITDYQLAMMLWPSLPQHRTKILFGNLDLQKFSPRENLQNGDVNLVNLDDGIIIDELAYRRICAYLCNAHNLTKKVENAANEFTKKFLIEEDRQKLAFNSKESYNSFLLPLITSIKARQGYTKDYVKNMGIVEFMTEISRLQIIINADALLYGAYGGMMDTSKIPKKDFDWCRSIETKKPNGVSLG